MRCTDSAQDSAYSRCTLESLWQSGAPVMIQSMGLGFQSCRYLLCDFGQVPSPLWAVSSSAKQGRSLVPLPWTELQEQPHTGMQAVTVESQ